MKKIKIEVTPLKCSSKDFCVDLSKLSFEECEYLGIYVSANTSSFSRKNLASESGGSLMTKLSAKRSSLIEEPTSSGSQDADPTLVNTEPESTLKSTSEVRSRVSVAGNKPRIGKIKRSTEPDTGTSKPMVLDSQTKSHGEISDRNFLKGLSTRPLEVKFTGDTWNCKEFEPVQTSFNGTYISHGPSPYLGKDPNTGLITLYGVSNANTSSVQFLDCLKGTGPSAPVTPIIVQDSHIPMHIPDSIVTIDGIGLAGGDASDQEAPVKKNGLSNNFKTLVQNNINVDDGKSAAGVSVIKNNVPVSSGLPLHISVPCSSNATNNVILVNNSQFILGRNVHTVPTVSSSVLPSFIVIPGPSQLTNNGTVCNSNTSMVTSGSYVIKNSDSISSKSNTSASSLLNCSAGGGNKIPFEVFKSDSSKMDASNGKTTLSAGTKLKTMHTASRKSHTTFIVKNSLERKPTPPVATAPSRALPVSSSNSVANIKVLPITNLFNSESNEGLSKSYPPSTLTRKISTSAATSSSYQVSPKPNPASKSAFKEPACTSPKQIVNPTTFVIQSSQLAYRKMPPLQPLSRITGQPEVVASHSAHGKSHGALGKTQPTTPNLKVVPLSVDRLALQRVAPSAPSISRHPSHFRMTKLQQTGDAPSKEVVSHATKLLTTTQECKRRKIDKIIDNHTLHPRRASDNPSSTTEQKIPEITKTSTQVSVSSQQDVEGKTKRLYRRAVEGCQIFRFARNVTLPLRQVQLFDVGCQTNVMSLLEPGRLIEVNIREEQERGFVSQAPSGGGGMVVGTLEEPREKMSRLEATAESTPMDVDPPSPGAATELETDGSSLATRNNQQQNKQSSVKTKQMNGNINKLIGGLTTTRNGDVNNINEKVVTAAKERNDAGNTGETATTTRDDNADTRIVAAATRPQSGVDAESLNFQMKLRVYKDWVGCVVKDPVTGNLPIHRAVLDGDLVALERQCFLLVGRKMTVDQKNARKLTPLHLAVMWGSVRAVEILRGNGARPSATDGAGNTAVHLAVGGNDVALLGALLGAEEQPMGLDLHNDDGYTSLHACCLHDRPQHAQLLLLKGADPNLKDLHSGRTPFFLAVELEHTDMVKTLLGMKAKASIPNYAGHTPLMYMSETPNVDPEIRKLVERSVHQELRGDGQGWEGSEEGRGETAADPDPCASVIVTNRTAVGSASTQSRSAAMQSPRSAAIQAPRSAAMKALPPLIPRPIERAADTSVGVRETVIAKNQLNGVAYTTGLLPTKGCPRSPKVTFRTFSMYAEGGKGETETSRQVVAQNDDAKRTMENAERTYLLFRKRKAPHEGHS